MKRLPGFIAIVFILLFFSVRLPSNRWNQVIHSDGKGYYAHLPALFIYNDLTYGFADDVEAKYYPRDGSMSKHFRFTYKGETVNKTFSGIAFLWLPFFLLAHFLSMIFGYPTDGYSLLYQLSIGLSAIFYCWLGCKLLLKFLSEFGISKWISQLVLVVLIFGTNYFYYLLYDPSLTHTYNFTLITAFLLFTKKYMDTKKAVDFLWASAVFAIILWVRPQNGFILFTVPFLAGNYKNFLKVVSKTLSKPKLLAMSFTIFGLIICMPMILWYLQTGYFIVYSYGNERFVFSNPQFVNVLFSYKKGLFIYTPIIFISLLGMIPLWRKSRFQFFSLSAFLLLNTYIISSWEEWWYGCSFGHRVFIDFYPVAALLLAFLIQWLSNGKWLKYLLSIVVTSALILNLIQSYQHYYSVVPSCDSNEEIYWDNFLRIIPKATAAYPKNTAAKTIMEMDLESEVNSPIIDEKVAFSGHFSQKIDKNNPYSASFRHKIDKNDAFLIISSRLYANELKGHPKLVVDIQDSSGSSQNYESREISRYLKNEEWVFGEWRKDFGPELADKTVVIYFWFPEGEGSLNIDNFKASFYQ